MIVYKAVNKINGKTYVGSTIYSLDKRKQGHRYSMFHAKNKSMFHKALCKYGWDAFTWSVLCEAKTEIELRELEAKYIKTLDTYNSGYNLTYGFDNTTTGYKFSEEQKRKMGKQRKGIGNGNYGKKWTDEQKQNASIRQQNNHKHLTGNYNPSKKQDVRNKISMSNMGSGNGMSKVWLITYPDGSKVELVGGLKRFLKNIGLTYSGFVFSQQSKKDSYKGFVIKEIKNVYDKGKIHRSNDND
jgi:group I intron endonuclease